MKVEIKRTTYLFPNSVFIQWDITDVTEDGINLVYVERAGSPNGPWRSLTGALQNAYHYNDELTKPDTAAPDENPNTFSMQRNVYYRVIVVPPSGPNNKIESTAVSIEPGLDTRTRLLKRKMLRDEAICLKKLNGIELLVSKKKHWGERCTVCYDPVTQDLTLEHCTTCFGTGFTDGYWTPVKIYGRIAPSPVQTQMSPHGKTEVLVTRLTLLDFPSLEEGDIVTDVRRNQRYIVRMVALTELKKVTVHQVVTMSLLSHMAIEYKIPVDQTNIPQLH